jgi:hypothetical protein
MLGYKGLPGTKILAYFCSIIIHPNVSNQYGGITLEYSGSDSAVERVNTSKPIKKDLIVEVNNPGDDDSLTITQHNDILHKDTQNKEFICDTQHQ